MTSPTPMSAPARKGRGRWAAMFVASGACLALAVASWWPGGAGVTVAEPAPRTLAAAPTAPATPTAASSPAPSTVTAAADVPVELAIPALGITAPVDAVGTGADGSLALPEEPARVGWYAAGPRPGGGAGSAVLAGHLDSRGGRLGPLAGLSRLAPGAEIVVVDATGARHLHVVRSVQTVAREDLYLLDPFRTLGEAVLTLITCTGAFDRERDAYPANLVVTATPVTAGR